MKWRKHYAVIDVICNGYSVKQTADHLGLSVRTIYYILKESQRTINKYIRAGLWEIQHDYDTRVRIVEKQREYERSIISPEDKVAELRFYTRQLCKAMRKGSYP
jgi:transcriptional antiterminator